MPSTTMSPAAVDSERAGMDAARQSLIEADKAILEDGFVTFAQFDPEKSAKMRAALSRLRRTERVNGDKW